MTNPHPLTDDIAESIAVTELQCPFGIGQLVFTHEDMRAAADWQLERVAEWIGENGLRGYVSTDSFTIIHTQEAIADLKKAMRPQIEAVEKAELTAQVIEKEES